MSRVRAAAFVALITAGAVLVGGGSAAMAVATEPCGPAGGTAQRLLGANTAAAEFGVDGTGIKVGIISNSYATRGQDKVEADIAAGWLPGPGNPCGRDTPVSILSEGPNDQDDEGRAMAQIVHQVAPGAEILFAAADSVDNYVSAIQDLTARGARIIVDDLAVGGDRPFHVDAAGQAIQQAVDAGVLYVTATGNYGATGGTGYPSAGYPIGAWSTVQYRPTSCPDNVAALYPGETIDCLDFDPGESEDATMTVTLPPGSIMIGTLDWAEEDNQVATSFDYVYTIGERTSKFVASDPQRASTPAEIGNSSSTDPTTNEVSIVRHVTPTAATPPISLIWEQALDTHTLIDQEYYQSTDTDTIGASLFGHRANPAALSVAAMNAQDSTLETYSTLGPAPLYFGVPKPLTIPGPTVVGVDNLPTSTTVLGDTGLFRGTSAAAPTIAASAALVLQYAPELTPTQLKQILTAHTSAAAVIQPWNQNVPSERSIGAGLINVESTLTALTAPKPTETAEPAPATPTETAEPAPATPTLAATGTSDVGPTPVLVALALILAGVSLIRRGRRRVTTELPRDS